MSFRLVPDVSTIAQCIKEVVARGEQKTPATIADQVYQRAHNAGRVVAWLVAFGIAQSCLQHEAEGSLAPCQATL